MSRSLGPSWNTIVAAEGRSCFRQGTRFVSERVSGSEHESEGIYLFECTMLEFNVVPQLKSSEHDMRNFSSSNYDVNEQQDEQQQK